MNKIPKGWEVKKLGDIAITSSGGTPLRTHSEYWNGNIKWLKISDLNDSLIDNSDEFITEIGLKNSSLLKSVRENKLIDSSIIIFLTLISSLPPFSSEKYS